MALREKTFVTPWGWEVPTTAHPAWHYTNLKGLDVTGMHYADAAEVPCPNHMVEGYPAGFGWGAVPMVAEVVTGELDVVHDGAAGVVQRPMRVLDVPAGATLVLRERLTGSGWQAPVLKLNIGAGATVLHAVVQDLARDAVLTGSAWVAVADDAHYTCVVRQRGGKVARVERVIEAGARAHVTSHALHETGNGQLHDHTVHVRHLDVSTQSHVVQRNVLRGGTSVFGGKFFVHQRAQQTNAYMHCHNLILGPDARAHQKPELEIYADDVKCSHGAVTGGLNAAQVEYLRMRGFNDVAAREILTAAFVESWVEALPEELKGAFV